MADHLDFPVAEWRKDRLKVRLKTNCSYTAWLPTLAAHLFLSCGMPAKYQFAMLRGFETFRLDTFPGDRPPFHAMDAPS